MFAIFEIRKIDAKDFLALSPKEQGQILSILQTCINLHDYYGSREGYLTAEEVEEVRRKLRLFNSLI